MLNFPPTTINESYTSFTPNLDILLCIQLLKAWSSHSLAFWFRYSLALAKLTDTSSSRIKRRGRLPTPSFAPLCWPSRLHRNTKTSVLNLSRSRGPYHDSTPLRLPSMSSTTSRLSSACNRALESSLAQIEKFEQRLCTGKREQSQVKGAGQRIQFNLAFQNNVQELTEDYTGKLHLD